jgi:hypothetical protein
LGLGPLVGFAEEARALKRMPGKGLTLFCGSNSLQSQKNSLFLKNNSLFG